MIDPEEVGLLQRPRARFHLIQAHALRARGADERANARAGVQHGADAALLQRAQHANVRESFESSAAEHDGDAGRDVGLGHGSGVIVC